MGKTEPRGAEPELKSTENELIEGGIELIEKEIKPIGAESGFELNDMELGSELNGTGPSAADEGLSGGAERTRVGGADAQIAIGKTRGEQTVRSFNPEADPPRWCNCLQ